MSKLMNTLRQCWRLLYIYHVFAKNGLDTLLVTIPVFRAYRFVSYANPWNWFRKPSMSRGEAIRVSFEELGPIFIKFGQALSTRPDILPADIAQALAQLQDNVPSFPSEEATEKIEEVLGGPVDVIFSHFDRVPLASASIAQVHAATLLDGRAVVVKVVRPGIRVQIEKDLALMKRFAMMLERYSKEARRFRLTALILEFQANLLDELDLRREGANGTQLRRHFMHSPLLYVPEIIWNYTHTEVLVMERIEGIPVSDRARLEALGVNLAKLAERGVEIFFTQVFENSFFHADMHPGNIFVSSQFPDDPSYICVDFGLMGSLSDEDQRYLAYNLYAFFNRDYRRVAELHIESGWVAKGTRVDVFESAIRTVCEPIFERPLSEISFAKLLLQLLSVGKKFQMEVQPQLMLLQKTLLAVEGLGRQLYPELDLWLTAKPFLEKWLRTRFGPKVFFQELKTQFPFFAEQLPHLPKLLYDVLELNKTNLELVQLRLVGHPQQVMRRSKKTLFFCVLLGTILGGAATVVSSHFLFLK
jgi:ubiquinone biosynthesis protein